MLFRLRLRGNGLSDDPYRVDLPTYNRVHFNITTREAFVVVPEEVHGLSGDELSSETIQDTVDGPLVVSLSDANLAKLHKHLDERYQEHKGKFRVENA